MIRFWLNLYTEFLRSFARPCGDPFRAPRRDIASEIAQGGNGLAVSATDLGGPHD